MPALNELLAPFGIAFGDAILEGQVPLEPDKPYYASGANIVRFPAGGHLHGWQLADKATEGVYVPHTPHSSYRNRISPLQVSYTSSLPYRNKVWPCRGCFPFSRELGITREFL